MLGEAGLWTRLITCKEFHDFRRNQRHNYFPDKACQMVDLLIVARSYTLAFAGLVLGSLSYYRFSPPTVTEILKVFLTNHSLPDPVLVTESSFDDVEGR